MDHGLAEAWLEVAHLDVQRENEAMGAMIAQVARDQAQSLNPILQDIIETQAVASSVIQ